MTEFRFGPIDPVLAPDTMLLTRQDLLLGRFPQAEEMTDPDNPTLLERQTRWLTDTPQNYVGAFTEDDEYVGYLKTMFWANSGQTGFAENAIERTATKVARRLSIGQFVVPRWAILGLVVDENVTPEPREELYHGFLDIASQQALEHQAAEVRIIVHDYDPLLSILAARGFKALRRGHASGVKGVEAIEQTLFGLPVELPNA